jgi:hypothetical protein
LLIGIVVLTVAWVVYRDLSGSPVAPRGWCENLTPAEYDVVTMKIGRSLVCPSRAGWAAWATWPDTTRNSVCLTLEYEVEQADHTGA